MAVDYYQLPQLVPVEGVEIAIGSAGIKKPGRKDVVVFKLPEGASVAGVFTQNAFCAAPVTVCRQHIEQTVPRVFVDNTGNANAGTGQKGYENALLTCQTAADVFGVDANQVLPFSTGVIGEHLPMDRLLPALMSMTDFSPNNLEAAATGIMTTDTRAKYWTSSFEFNGETVVVSGISKGSGMIKPNMATMLGYVFTNASISTEMLQKILTEGANKSFNRITVDGDTSTNDCCMLASTNKTMAQVNSADDALYEPLKEAIIDVLQKLAHLIVLDGEGATKFVAINVVNAASNQEALDVAYTVAHSPLVKTALTASDANWGRILAAVGRAGLEKLDVERVNVQLDDVSIVENGARADGYTDMMGSAVFKKSAFDITIDLNRGEHQDTVWTTDLSYEYVRINAEYRS